MVSSRPCSRRPGTDSFSSLGCTAKAITHRVQKFRDAASKLGLQNGAAPFTTPASGKKRARKTKTDDDQDGGDADDTPTKKPRTPKVKNSAVIKDDTVDVEQMVKKELSDEDDIEVAA